MSQGRGFRFWGWGEKGGNTNVTQNFFPVILQNVSKLLLVGQQTPGIYRQKGATFDSWKKASKRS